MKLGSTKRSMDFFFKTNLNEILYAFNIKKKQFLLILAVFVIATSYANSKSMTCALPADSLVERSTKQPDPYLKLLEPITTIQLSALRKIEKFSSPGCHKTESVTFWTNSVEIECNSNDGTAVNLQINFFTSKFGKIYTQKNKKVRSLTGLCSKLKH